MHDAIKGSELMDEQKYEQNLPQQKGMEETVGEHRQAAQQGDAMAQYELARTYYQHNEYAKAFYWWEKSAENGLNAAWVRLAIQWAYGLGTEKDEDKALDLLWKAVKGDPADANALCHLGMFYEQGIGADASMEQALTCYRQAAEMGDPMAYFALGMCYFYGKGVTEDTEAALEWVNKAGEANYAEAQYFLGLQYFLGERVERDLYLSLKYLRASADAGSEDAQQLLPLAEREVNVARQQQGINEVQKMLDEYEAYMTRAAMEMGFEDEEDKAE